MPRAMLIFEDVPEYPGQPRMSLVSDPAIIEDTDFHSLSAAQQYALLTFRKLGHMLTDKPVDPATGAPTHDETDPRLD